MSKFLLLLFITSMLVSGCSHKPKTPPISSGGFTLDTLTLTDTMRNREIPVAYFIPQTAHSAVVIFSHGYAANQPASYLHYSYLTEFLAAHGYWVVSIQHELPTDSLIPSTGIPQIVRRPFWDRGAENIRFVIQELEKTHPEADLQNLTLIGHSNGADMTALFAEKYPDVATKIITLDNRRMALPRTQKLKVYSLRSCDQPADDGVLPTKDEQEKFGITIIKLPATLHNDMDDRGTEKQKKEIADYVLKFLKE